MLETFVPLAQLLRAGEAQEVAPREESSVEVPHAQDVEATEVPQQSTLETSTISEVYAEARRFRAALADAADLMREWIARDIACDVLARELLLADADVAAIAERAVRRAMDLQPLTVVVHPDDAVLMTRCQLPIVTHGEIRRGDVQLRVRAGTIDATLGARLASMLEMLG